MKVGTQKKFLEPQKPQKNIFSEKPKSGIWPNIRGGSHNSPGHKGTIRPLATIQKLII